LLTFLQANSHNDEKIRFIIICARYKNQWLFVRNKNRTSYELPAGHIEDLETPIEAAARELYEETGAVDFSIIPMVDYCFNDKEGRVFFADVNSLGELPDYEIAEIISANYHPFPQTYPQLHPQFLKYAKNFVRGMKNEN